jgi:hypothetical protein
MMVDAYTAALPALFFVVVVLFVVVVISSSGFRGAEAWAMPSALRVESDRVIRRKVLRGRFNTPCAAAPFGPSCPVMGY